MPDMNGVDLPGRRAGSSEGPAGAQGAGGVASSRLEMVGQLAALDLAAGRRIVLTVNGNSNYPFLRHGRDKVTIAPLTSSEPAVGRDNGHGTVRASGRATGRAVVSAGIRAAADESDTGTDHGVRLPRRDQQVMAANRQSLHRGDLVLTRVDASEYLMHRIVRCRDGAYWMCGDAGTRLEGPFMAQQALGRVVTLHRQQRDGTHLKIPADSRLLRMLVRVWLLLRLFRPFALQLLRPLSLARRALRPTR